jgi:NADH:ubiquinone oxidoreductase subunit 4 (subunit M)
MFDHLISTLIVIPLLGVAVVLLSPEKYARVRGLGFSWRTFLFSLFLWILFDRGTGKFQFVDSYD